MLQDIVFPLMSYSEQDAEMWDTDPYEYIRIKFDIFEVGILLYWFNSRQNKLLFWYHHRLTIRQLE